MEGPYSARFYRIPVGGLRVSRRFEHRPVLLSEVVELMSAIPEGVVVDGTLGGGGHAQALLARLDRIRLLGIDRDPAALRAAAALLGAVGKGGARGAAQDRFVTSDGRVTLVRGRFSDIEAITEEYGGGPVTGVLLDLGVSSHQLDEAGRGFAYSKEAVLDMRMDPDLPRSAADVLADEDEDELVRIFRDLGEERHARRIARAVVRRRARRPILTTRDLADLVRDAIPAAARRTGPNPARRTFQALRMEVNDELGELARALDAGPALLALRGRMAVISYHSLEDRMVKQAFASLSNPAELPAALPLTQDQVAGVAGQPSFHLLTKRPVRPGPEEIASNPRSDSARMRSLERVA